MSTLYARSINPALVNPALMQNAQAGPSTRTEILTKRKAASTTAKRKRTGSPDESSTCEQQNARKNSRDGPKKKKATRACFHCQKAHLTCDDSRPCHRCVRRGISDCTEGHRKKAKYLLDEQEIQHLKSKTADSATDVDGGIEQPQVQQSLEAPELVSMPSPQNADAMFGIPFDPNYTFGSEAANLEYSILSAILGNPSPPDSGPSHAPSPPPPQAQFQPWAPQTSPPNYSTRTGSYDTSQMDPSLATSSNLDSYSYMQSSVSQTQDQQQPPYNATVPFRHPTSGQQGLHPLAPRYPFLQDRSPPGSVFLNPLPPSKDGSYFRGGRDIMSPPPSSSNGTSSSATTSIPPLRIGDLCHLPGPTSQLQSINDRITAPYDYTEGYHFLMKHLPTRFEKNDILRIVRALAIFRPSLIALQMPLSLDDEVFLEKCFQRSLLELEKLISFSGTPTVIWRRTGEICLVAPEFCMLTDWTMEELVGRKKFIYELFENQSVVEYWESFASHAFENTTQSVYSHCVLLKPNGAPIPATFSFTIRRDLFDLPSVIVGQWLPLL